MKQTYLIKYAGVLAVLTQLFVIYATGAHTGFNWLGTKPISDLGVTNIFCLYSIGLALGAVLLTFFLQYLQFAFNTGRVFNILFSIGIACEFVTGLAPDQPMAANPFSSLFVLHLPADILLLLIIPVAMWSFALTPRLNASIRHMVIWLAISYVVLLIPEIFLIRLNVLYAASESVSLLLFDAWIIYLTYAKPLYGVASLPSEKEDEVALTV